MDEKASGTGLPQDLSALALDSLPVAITMVDPWGAILYFNQRAAEILDRQPEYLGRDVRFCHAKPESVARIDTILADFRAGSEAMVEYEAVRPDRKLRVLFTPLRQNGALVACVQTVVEIGPA